MNAIMEIYACKCTLVHKICNFHVIFVEFVENVI